MNTGWRQRGEGKKGGKPPFYRFRTGCKSAGTKASAAKKAAGKMPAPQKRNGGVRPRLHTGDPAGRAGRGGARPAKASGVQNTDLRRRPLQNRDGGVKPPLHKQG